MSEYWKSTPKYWCKHCKTYVRDTKLEKTNHEATPKHQGNLKRFLRDLHRGHEKEEKDKDRAKSEVARLNGLVAGEGSGSGSGSGGSYSSSGFGRGPTPVPKPQATAGQRKQQLAQLAEMGVSIPDEFRPDMAMAGEWQVTAERIVETDGEKKPEAIALGVRKRTVEEDEEEAKEAKRLRWGSRFKTHPAEEDTDDLDALLANATRKDAVPAVSIEVKEEVKQEVKEEADGDIPKVGEVKKEASDGDTKITEVIPPSDAIIKPEGEEGAPGVVFKKRKAKNIRQK
ncbi:Uncharacterized protein LHYA1_G008491 [Lachnellula hyalina]|uniref:U1-type domain-containing protein n=1 Tax=Lachnellula hyalina TaxID=1316788 RepID=A0A8H8QTF1_9HELO|nr:Uncharacterized protein LHYA1_G008491 [Lachnellula hyalina]TVY22448.1 Uncharacterized protein LHYA1_G008491 [Lachnellula hyalina]